MYKFDDLDRERAKVIRKKNKRREKRRLLLQNTRKKLLLIVTLLNQAAIEYKNIFYEDDYYRQKRLIEVSEKVVKEVLISKEPERENEISDEFYTLSRDDFTQMDEETQSTVKKSILKQIKEFYYSPYEDDKRFAVSYIGRITRQDFGENELVKSMFFFLIFDLIIESEDEVIVVDAYDSLCNLTQDEETRLKLATEGYYKKVFENIDIYECGDKILDSISWLTTLI